MDPLAAHDNSSLRARGQILPMVGVVVVVLFTLANAALNLIPCHRASAAELRKAELRDVVADRRQRIIALRGRPEACQPAAAHELARLLVMDGQWDDARSYADAYEQQCGADPVVRHWGAAPRPRTGVATATAR
jgi:hypothetical protein